MKKKIVFLLIASITVVIAISAISASDFFIKTFTSTDSGVPLTEEEKIKFEQYGAYINELNDEDIDGLNRSTFKRYHYYFMNIQGLSESESFNLALDETIKREVFQKKAREFDIEISNEQLINRAAEERKMLDQADNAEEVKTMLESLLQGLGMSEEDYWNHYLPSKYWDVEVEERLFEHMNRDIDDHELKQENWRKFVDESIADYKRKNEQTLQEFIEQMD